MSETPASDDTNQSLKELQSWWEIPSICQYVSLFRDSFNLPEIEIEDLENGLMEDTTESPSKWLKDLLFSFLKSIMPGRVNAENWEIQLQKLIQRRWPDGQEVPFPDGKSFSELSLRSKVDIIYSLCLYRLDKSDTPDLMKSTDAEALRVQKLGTDCEGNAYWYFYGTRLYKEEVSKEKPWKDEWVEQKQQSLKRGRGRPRKIRPPVNRKSDGESDDFEDMNNGYMNANAKSRWSVVCDTMEEWVNFAEKFQSSKNSNEKALFKIIQENFLPVLNQIYEEKEKKLQQKLKELMPMREKIITRRETRKLRGEIFESPTMNGYASDEAHRMHLIRDRTRRLEERNKRASEGDIHRPSRRKRSYASMQEDFSYDETEDNSWAVPSISPPQIKRTEDANFNNRSIAMGLISEMERLLRDVKLHKDAWPFLYPVNEDEVPGYKDIIKEPMDLTTIESKLFEGNYETLEDLNSDFYRMVSNCKLFNGENHVYSKMANTLWKVYQNGLSKILDSLDQVEKCSNASDSPASLEDSSDAQDLHTLPHYQGAQNAKVPKKSKLIKKKKKIPGMEALEILAHASEVAIKSSNASDVRNSSMSDSQGSNDFPNLKVMPIHCHPQELIEKFSQSSNESSNEITGENMDYENSEYLNHAESSDNQDARTSSGGESPEVEGPVNYMNNTFSQLTNFIEKNNARNLNILSHSDVSNVLPESDSNSHDSRHTSPIHESDATAENNNLGHNLNILDANVSHIFSQMIPQPVYTHSNQVIPQNKGDNVSYIENSPKQSKNIRKSPQTSVSSVGYTITDNLPHMQESVVAQTDLGSPAKSITTIDASAIGIPSYHVLPKEPQNSVSPGQRENFSKKSPVSNVSMYPKSSTNPQVSPNGVKNVQQSCSPNSINCDQTVAVPNISYQPFNFDNVNNINGQTTFVSSVSTNSVTDIPLQIPASFSKPQQQSPKIQVSSIGANTAMNIPLQVPVPQQSKIQMETMDNFLRVRMPQGGGQLVVVSDPNPTGVTLHVYSKSKMDQNFASEHITVSGNKPASNPVQNLLKNLPGSIPSTLPLSIPHGFPGGNSSTKPRVFSNLQDRMTENQGNVNRTSPQQKSTIPVNYQVAPHVPSKRMPYTPVSTSSSDASKAPLPATNSSFVPVNSPSVNKNKQSFRAKGLTGQATVSPENMTASFNMNSAVSTSYNNNNSGVTQNHNNLYQTLGSKTLPVVFSGYNQLSASSQNDLRFKNNPSTVITTQPNLSVPNGLPVVQQVLIPAAPQQLSVPNGRQIVFATSQNSVNGMFNQEQSAQMQNIQQINQGFTKVVPQIVESSPLVTVSKDVMKNLQLPIVAQNHSQVYTQGVPSQQFMNIPSYMFTNQNLIQTASQPVMNLQTFQMAQSRQMNGGANT